MLPAPIACGCDPLVEQVAMATDDFYYGTSAFAFWAQLGLGNFQLKHLPEKLHRAPARGESAGSPVAQAAGASGRCVPRASPCSHAEGSAGTQGPALPP